MPERDVFEHMLCRPYLKSIEEDTLLLLDGETDHLTGVLIDGAVLIVGDALHGIARLKEASGRLIVREFLLRLGIKRHLLLLLVRHVEGSGGRRRRSGPPNKGTRRRREGIAPARKEGQSHGKESGVHPEDHLDTDNSNACGARAWGAYVLEEQGLFFWLRRGSRVRKKRYTVTRTDAGKTTLFLGVESRLLLIS